MICCRSQTPKYLPGTYVSILLLSGQALEVYYD